MCQVYTIEHMGCRAIRSCFPNMNLLYLIDLSNMRLSIINLGSIIFTSENSFGQSAAVRAFTFSKIIAEDEMVESSDHKRVL